MAINTGTTARVHWGDIAAINGAASLSFCITIKPTAAPTNGYRYVGQWGTLSQAFLLYSSTSDHCALAVGTNGTWIRIYRASSVAFVSGTQYRVFVRWTAGTRTININGSDSTIVTDTSTGTEGVLGNSPDDVAIGFEAGGPTANGIPGDRSEFAIWTEYVPDWVVAAYAAGESPDIYRNANSVLYCPLFNTSDINDRWRGVAGTNSSGTNATHPGVRYPWKSRSSTYAGTSPPPPPPSNTNYLMPMLGVGDD